MAQIKIQQKIPMNTFKTIGDQLKAEGIHFITHAAFQSGRVDNCDVLGNVVSAFNLGAKIAVDVSGKHCTDGARFEKLDDQYFLVAKAR